MAVVLATVVGCGAPEGAEEARGSVAQGLMNAPDFVVTALSRPASAAPGSSFQAMVTVCNRGDVGGGVEAGLFLSADSSISTMDSWAGSAYVSYLSPGECQTLSTQVYASVPANGAWYLGALADPFSSQWEADETNNTYVGDPMGIGYGADFVVTAVKGPASVQPGQSFTAQVTVCNQGQQADSADVGVFLSADATIRAPVPPNPPEDSQAGNASTPYLYPGQCATVAVPSNAYTPPSNTPTEAWYLGAVVDPYLGRPELIENNNTHSGYLLGVGSKADFIVTSVKGPASVQYGQSFTAQVTVCNQGQQHDSTEVGVYLSADATIRAPVAPNPPEDAQVGNTNTPPIAPGQCATVSVSGNAYPPPPNSPTPVEAWYLGAVADPYSSRPELIESNNTNSGYLLGVGYKADFVVTSVKGPASAQYGQAFTAQVTVCNQGQQGDSTDVSLFLSTDTNIRAPVSPGPPEDSQVGNTYVPYTAPGQCTTVAVSGNAYPPPSNSPPLVEAWYLGAVADPYNSRPELIESNNTSSGYLLGVGGKSDFIITSVKGPASVQSGQSFTAQVTVCNQGQYSESTDVSLFLSADSNIQPPMPPGPPEDSFAGNIATPYLSPGQCATVAVPGNAYTPPTNSPTPVEAWYLGAVVDPYNSRPELIEANNTNSGYLLGVGNKADFIITAVKGPASVQSGQAFTAQVTVCNQGQQADSADVGVFLSEDALIRVPVAPNPPEDSQAGNAYTPYLYPGQCATVSVPGNAYTPPSNSPTSTEAWYLGAVVDPYLGRPELLEDNNTHSGYLLGVGNKADFIVTSVKGPASVQSGQSFTAQVTVCNQGQQGDSTEVGVYLSADATIRAPVPPNPPEDSPVGNTYTPYIAPGQCATVSVSGNAYTPPSNSPTLVEAWYLGAVVDPYSSRPELIESNNTHSGYLLGVGDKADFVVTSVKGPASAQYGQSFTAQVTVCNQGQQGESTDVSLFLSADSNIQPPMPPGPPEDSFVGNIATPYLSPGQCATVAVPGNAHPPPSNSPPLVEAWYLGAVVDPNRSRPELIEDNNTSSGYLLGVGDKSDFIVTSVKGPASVQSGQSFTAQVTVCNQGQYSESTDVSLFLSADSNIQPPMPPAPPEDSFVGNIATPYLSPGQCATVAVPGNAYTPPTNSPTPVEAWYLGAVVDPHNSRPELIEANNTNSGYLLGVGNKADFIITAVKGPASVQSGQAFTAQVTVCNQGQQADSADVGVFLSADAIIRVPVAPNPPEDSQAGNAYTPYLYPGQCATVSVPGNAYTPPSNGPGEAWYLGAVVDPYLGRPELLEDNNTHSGYLLGVGNKADFIVTSVKGPASVQHGQSFTAQVTVCNQGQQGDSTEVGVYLSEDATIRAPLPPNPPEDSQVGNTYTPYIAPGQCATVAVPGNAYPPPTNSPMPVEAWYLGAVVDPYSSRPELIESNNTHSGYLLGMGSRADFIVTSVKGPASTKYGQAFTAQVTVCNQGQQADSTDVSLFLSADANIQVPTPPAPPEDSFAGNIATPSLAPGQCATVAVPGNAYPPPSNSPPLVEAWYLGAVVDPNRSRPELIESNNTNAGYLLGVGEKADFIVTSVKGPASVQPGQAFTAQVTVCNQGQYSESTDVTLLLSADANIQAPTPPAPPEDSFVGNIATPYLSPGQCATVAVPGNAYTPPTNSPIPVEAWYLGAVVDPHNSRTELIEANNTNSGYLLGVGNKADFVVTSVTGPNSVKPGQAFTAQVTVCNQGQQADSTDVGVFLSEDTLIRAPVPPNPPEDSQAGNASTPYLYPGQCATVAVSGNAYTPPSNGLVEAWYLGAVVDPYLGRPELIEDNNTSSGYLLGVGNKADFVVTAVTGPNSVKQGATFNANVTLCNRGQLSDSTAVEVYLSADNVIRGNTPPLPPEDFLLGTVTMGPLGVGACATKALVATAPSVPDGAYYLGAVADPSGSRPELIESNNAAAGNRIGVGNRADFVVTSVTGPNSIKPGVAFTANVTLCNRGQLSDTVDAAVLLSADTTVQLPNPPGPSEDSYLGSVTGVALAAGQCLTRSLSVTAPSVPDGAYYLGAIADPSSSRPELIEDNNAAAGNRIGVGFRPDFVVTAVTGPTSVQVGGSFSATFTVCNRGQQSSLVDVDLYFSADTTIRRPASPLPPEDFFLGSVTGISLGVGACTSRTLTVPANVPSTGAYYLGAIADPYESRQELIEDNNSKAGTLVSVTP
jgi:subtilase family serine protease